MVMRNDGPGRGLSAGPALVPDDGLSDLRAAIQAKLAAGPGPRERRKLEKSLADLNAEDGRFMRIYDVRRMEIREALAALPKRTKGTLVGLSTVMEVLNEAAFSMERDGQRMGMTQAELAASLGISAEAVSVAFQMLSHDTVRAVLDRQFCRKSVTWEIDAGYASRLGASQHLAALKRQDEWHAARDAERKRAERAERVGKVSLREVPFEVVPGGRVDDERQPPLIAE